MSDMLHSKQAQSNLTLRRSLRLLKAKCGFAYAYGAGGVSHRQSI